MNNQSFSQVYKIQEQIVGLEKQSQTAPKVNVVSKGNGADLFISVHFPKTIDFETFIKLRRFKYISVMQPQAYFDKEDNEYILIYLNYHDHRLNQKRLQEYKDQEFQRIQDKNTKQEKRVTHANHLVLQLALLFAELEKRQYKWPLEQIEQLYYINGLLYITLADYDFNSQKVQNTCFQQFINFIHKYFPEELVKIQQKTLSEVVKCLCKNYITSYNHSGDNDTSYENVLKHLLQVDQFKKINGINANSDVKEFKIPDNLLDLHPQLSNLEKKCVYKATKMIYPQKEIILKRINTEIDILERNNSELISFSLSSLYFRIFDQSYLIMKFYPFTLWGILQNWKPTEENLKKDVYAFSYKFAKALNDLHAQYFLHRNLNPDSLYLNQNEIGKSDIIIGSFSRSKINDHKSDPLDCQYNYGNDEMFNPPEEYQLNQKQFSYDVFQYGLIVLLIANKGKYVGNYGPQTLLYMNKFDEFYSPQAITQTLSHFNYEKDFIDLLIQCLQLDPNQRPDSQNILKITEKLQYINNVQTQPNQIQQQGIQQIQQNH